MAYELREGQGSLFKNEHRTSDKHPNARGEILIGGVLYEIAAWTKQGKKGPFQSLQAKPKEARQERAPAQQQGMYDRDDPRTAGGGFSRELDDEIPF